ncbi:putative leader peptide [Actinoallomurus acanthiterrae]
MRGPAAVRRGVRLVRRLHVDLRRQAGALCSR